MSGAAHSRTCVPYPALLSTNRNTDTAWECVSEAQFRWRARARVSGTYYDITTPGYLWNGEYPLTVFPHRRPCRPRPKRPLRPPRSGSNDVQVLAPWPAI